MFLAGFLVSVGTKAGILETIYRFFEKPSFLNFLTTGAGFQAKPTQEYQQPIPKEEPTPKLPHDYVLSNNFEKIYDKLSNGFRGMMGNVIERMPQDKVLKLTTEFSSESPNQTLDAKFNTILNMVIPYMNQEEKFKICSMIEPFKIFKFIQNIELYGLSNSKVELLALEFDKNNKNIFNIIVNIPNQGKKRISLNDLAEQEQIIILYKLLSPTLEKMGTSLDCSKCVKDLLEDYK